MQVWLVVRDWRCSCLLFLSLTMVCPYSPVFSPSNLVSTGSITDVDRRALVCTTAPYYSQRLSMVRSTHSLHPLFSHKYIRLVIYMPDTCLFLILRLRSSAVTMAFAPAPGAGRPHREPPAESVQQCCYT